MAYASKPTIHHRVQLLSRGGIAGCFKLQSKH